jgi:hypothetical protein
MDNDMTRPKPATTIGVRTGQGLAACALLAAMATVALAQAGRPEPLGARLLQRVDLSAHARAGSFERSSLQFGDLDGDGRHSDFVRSQNGTRLQAFAWDGKGEPKLLWSWESPVAAALPLPPDRYFYKTIIHDLDGDGRAEIVAAVAHEGGKLELRVLDGISGAVKARHLTTDGHPTTPDPVRETRVRLSVADLSGKGRPTEILYQTERDSHGDIFAFDASLKPLWDTTGDNDVRQRIHGHYLWHADLDGDGKEEIITGTTFGPDGKARFRLTPGFWAQADLFYDHLDRVIVGDLDPARPGLEIIMSYEFNQARLTDAKGREIWSKPLLRGDAKLAAAGEFRPDLPGQEILAFDPNAKNRLTMFSIDGQEIGTIATPDGRFDGYVIDFDGDVTRDEVFQSQGAAVLSPATGRSVVLAQNYLKDARTATLPANRVFGLAVDLTGDRREEIVLWDDDELLVYGAEGPAAAGDGWWSKPAYRIAMANAMNDNHPERPHLDFRALAGLPPPAAGTAKPEPVVSAEQAAEAPQGADREERRATLYQRGKAALAIGRAGREIKRTADHPLAGNAFLAPPQGARQVYTFRSGDTAILTFRLAGKSVDEVVDAFENQLAGQSFARAGMTGFVTASDGPARLNMTGATGALALSIGRLEGARDTFEVLIDLSGFGG